MRDLPWLSQPRVDDEWSGLSKADIFTLYSALFNFDVTL